MLDRLPSARSAPPRARILLLAVWMLLTAIPLSATAASTATLHITATATGEGYDLVMILTPPLDGIAAMTLSITLPDGWRITDILTPTAMTLTHRAGGDRVDVLLDAAENQPLPTNGEVLRILVVADAIPRPSDAVCVVGATLYRYRENGALVVESLPDHRLCLADATEPSPEQPSEPVNDPDTSPTAPETPNTPNTPETPASPAARYIGCRETRSEGGIFAVQFLFTVADYTDGPWPVTAFPARGGGTLTLSAAWEDTVDILTPQGTIENITPVEAERDHGRWYILTFDGLMAERDYTFFVSTGDTGIDRAAAAVVLIDYTAGMYAGCHPLF